MKSANIRNSKDQRGNKYQLVQLDQVARGKTEASKDQMGNKRASWQVEYFLHGKGRKKGRWTQKIIFNSPPKKSLDIKD